MVEIHGGSRRPSSLSSRLLTPPFSSFECGAGEDFAHGETMLLPAPRQVEAAQATRRVRGARSRAMATGMAMLPLPRPFLLGPLLRHCQAQPTSSSSQRQSPRQPPSNAVHEAAANVRSLDGSPASISRCCNAMVLHLLQK
nr:uncharacterized protein LOC117840119 [Setaria viridis]